MAINSPVKKNIARELVPAGNHIARLYSIVHIGVLSDEYMGQPRETDTVRLSFELPEETRTFGDKEKPMVISQKYTNSMHEKANLGKLVRGMLGVEWHPNEDTESIDLTSFIGKACMLNVIHKSSAKGNEYEQIVSAAPLPKGIEAKPQINPSFVFDFDENWSEEALANFPQFMREDIMSTRNYKMKTGQIPMAEEFDKTPDPDKEYASSLGDAVEYGEEIDPFSIPF